MCIAPCGRLGVGTASCAVARALALAPQVRSVQDTATRSQESEKQLAKEVRLDVALDCIQMAQFGLGLRRAEAARRSAQRTLCHL
jgi:hypothetical protein